MDNPQKTKRRKKAGKAKKEGPPFWKRALAILSPISSILGIILIQIPLVTLVYGAVGILLGALCGRGLEDNYLKQQKAGIALGIVTIFVALYVMF